MSAGVYDIVCEQGSTFRRTFRWLDSNEQAVDLTGFTAEMHVRTNHKAATTIVELSTGLGGITISPSEGRVQIELSATQTAALPVVKGVYDLELRSSGGIVTRLLEGKFTVSPEVTRT